MINDQQLGEFLDKLVEDQRGKNGLMLTQFENDFVASAARCGRAFFFTEGRRTVIDRMWRRYGAELNHPHPMDRVTERPQMAAADPAGCEFIVKDEVTTRQRRCNEPAEFREPGRLRYCQMHAEVVQQTFKRKGQTIPLVKFL